MPTSSYKWATTQMTCLTIRHIAYGCLQWRRQKRAWGPSAVPNPPDKIGLYIFNFIHHKMVAHIKKH